MVPEFHTLTIAEKRLETADAVSLRFAVPAQLAAKYRFVQGQFLTLRAVLDGEDVRRSYSICSAVDDGELRVAVKRVDGGRFSNFAFEQLKAGQLIEVMTPDGRFFTALDAGHRKHYLAFAAGSGITPVLSHIKTIFRREPKSRFTLIYGNRNHASILFGEELEDLKDRYLDRFALYHVLSREPQEVELFHGRIDAAKCAAFLEMLVPVASIDEVFVCGPYSMIDEVSAALTARGFDSRLIHVERFGTPPAAGHRGVPASAPALATVGAGANVTAILDGKRRQFTLGYHDIPVLDALLQITYEAPYACKAGVCCTCRARVLEGEVVMDNNYTLEEEEIARGFVLTCQAHPRSPRLVVSYDER
jgi:ring-1,2-phenylacetyl-CoA epoxidase subunit PaaE